MYYQCTTNDLNYFYFVRKRKIQMRCKEFLVAMCGTAPKIFFKKEIRFYTRITISGPLTLILTSWHATSSQWNSHLEKQLSGFSILQRKFLGLTAFRLIHRSSQLLKDTLGVQASKDDDDDDSVTFCGGGRMVTRNPCLGVLICSACHREMKPKYLHL